MRLYIHVKSYFDWEPVPADVTVTEDDIKSGRVRPGYAGGYLMRVPKEKETHTEALIPENQIIQMMLSAYLDRGKCGTILTRHEAVARVIEEHVQPHHFTRKAVKSFEVFDDGPSEELFRAMLQPHMEADHGRAMGKNIEEEDAEALLAAYMEPCEDGKCVEHECATGGSLDHARSAHHHLCKVFKVAGGTAKKGAH